MPDIRTHRTEFNQRGPAPVPLVQPCRPFPVVGGPSGRPEVTTEYPLFPVEGVAPFALPVRALLTGGLATTLTWLARIDGAWREVLVTDPAHLEHTYNFPRPGDYDVAVRVDGPGGTSQTTAQRRVTVRKERRMLTYLELVNLEARLEDTYKNHGGHPERPAATYVDTVGWEVWRRTYLERRASGQGHEAAMRAVESEIDRIEGRPDRWAAGGGSHPQ